MNSRAEMGVGTLIIFIALLLVAAIAAGVLIQTAGSLQQKALNTGSQATSQISTNAVTLEVSGVSGLTNLENLTMVMKLAPGSDMISMGNSTLMLDLGDSSTTYIYSGSGAYSVNATTDNGTFGVTYVQNGQNSKPGLLVRGDVIRVLLRAPRTLVSGESVKLRFVPKFGTPTQTSFAVADVLTTQQVYLYP